MLESIPGQVFVVGVSLLIATIAYSTQLFIILPAMEWWSVESAVALIPFNILVLLLYYNYYLACTTDPGKVPVGWEPPYSTFQIEENRKCNREKDNLPATDTGITGPRYCKSCKHYKPPRAHHCRYCKRCVLKMDHHCPWIGNCVGYDNYGHFVRFVLYVDMACTYAFALLGWRVMNIMDGIRHFRFNAEPSTFELVMLVVNFILTFVVLFSVGILSIYHLYCMARNQSSVESWERSKVKTLIRRGKIMPVNYPFDVGFYRNICSVLGNNPLLWLWPQKPTGDGLSFPVRPGTDPRLPYSWPPRDPDDLRPSIFSNRYKRKKKQETLKRNKLVRRDSEGYLVREITMEERMAMVQQQQQQLQEDGNTNIYQEQLQSETSANEEVGYEADEVDSVEDYYDSGSCISGSDAEYDRAAGASGGDLEQSSYPIDTRFMDDRIYELSGKDYYDGADHSGSSSWEDGDEQHHYQPEYSKKEDDYYVNNDDDDDNVPLMSIPQERTRPPHHPSPKVVKED